MVSSRQKNCSDGSHVNHTARRGDGVQRAGFRCFSTIFFEDSVIFLEIKMKVEGADKMANELTNL